MKSPSKSILAACLAAGLLATAVLPAQAVTTLNFSAQLANASESSFTGGNTQFDFWSVVLDEFTPFTVSPGEAFVVTVTFDGLHTLPTASENRFIRLFMQGPGFAGAGDTSTQGGVELQLSGTPPVTVTSVTNQGCGTGESLAACVVLPQPNDTPYTFDQAVFSFTIDTLDQPREVSQMFFDTVLTTPVPELPSVAMLLAGAGLLLARRRLRGEPS
jgi:hypothetical protein